MMRRTRTRRPATVEELEAAFDSIVRAFARTNDVTTGLMMASTGLKVNGRIFAMFVRGQFVAKLPRERVDTLVRAGFGVRFDPRRDGRLMREWVAVSGDAPTWASLAREAYDFVKRSTTKR